METIAFKMFLKPGCIDEYKRRCREVWPEIESITRATGVVDFKIFLDEETLTLFAIQSIDTGRQLVSDVADHPIMKKWWHFMSSIIETNDDNTPVLGPLSKVYHMNGAVKTSNNAY
jgi:L-rhamnose mutarotase